jgi:hypothetical protein
MLLDPTDPQHNQVFVEGQRSARMAPSEKERAPSHLGCRPLCWRLCRWAVGTDATCAESRGPALGKAVDHGLPRLTGLGRELGGAVGRVHLFADGPPSAHVPMPRAPLGSRQRSNSFFIFGLSFFFAKGTLIKTWFPILVLFWQSFTIFHVFSSFFYT